MQRVLREEERERSDVEREAQTLVQGRATEYGTGTW
jgi:hypothetical protein